MRVSEIEKYFVMVDNIPVFETEDGSWIGHGTWDKTKFLDTIVDISYRLTGENIIQDIEERDMLLSFVHHIKSRPEFEPDFMLHWKKEDQEHKDAIDITVLLI